MNNLIEIGGGTQSLLNSYCSATLMKGGVCYG